MSGGRIVLGGIVLVLVILLLLPVVVPPFLDRIYYRGPASNHFNGQYFFNPEDRRASPQAERQRGFSLGRMIRFWRSPDRATWPASVPVRQDMPPARVAGDAMRVSWVGHSTVLIQTQGLNILTDPVWSERASPVPFAGPKRVTVPGVAFSDLPKIDLVLLSHDHYDHMDLATLKRLWQRDRPLIVTSLGNDAILRGRGIEAQARDWGGRVSVRPGIDVIVERVHHWGSRTGRDRNRALWSGFTVTLPGGNLFFAGDTGWGDGTWVGEAARRGPIRLALIPIGAIEPRDMMAPSHIEPAEAVRVFQELGAAHALAVHWGTFQLSYEQRNAPPELLGHALDGAGIAKERFRALPVGGTWEIPAR